MARILVALFALPLSSLPFVDSLVLAAIWPLDDYRRIEALES